MGFFYEQETGAKGVIYDDGNNIILMPFGGRINRQMIISRDYRSELNFFCDADKVCIAYFNIQNDLVWHTVGEGERVVLLSGTIDGFEMSNIRIEKLATVIFVFYMVKKSNKQYEIRYVPPFGNRNSKTLLVSEYPVESYKFYENNGEWYCNIKLLEESTGRQYVINIDKMGDINLEECKLYKCKDIQKIKDEIQTVRRTLDKNNIYIEQLKKDVSEREERLNQSLHKAQEVYDNMLQDEANKIEKQYKKQYDELAKLTQEIQNEGKRWRELYYKNVKK